MKHIKILIFLLLFTTIKTVGQEHPFSWGIQLGLGTISGNFVSFTSLNPAVFSDFSVAFAEPVYFKLKAGYYRNTEYFLRGGSGRDLYFPYLINFNLDACFEYPIQTNAVVSQGVGPQIVIDRTFSGLNETDYGVNFFAEIKFKTSKNPAGSYFGGGFEYGITFTNTNVSYSNFYLKYQF